MAGIDTARVMLEVKDLEKHFPIRKGVLKSTVGWVPAVDGINFTLREGETLGLVGESGCGKTTAIRTIMRMYEPTAGNVYFRLDQNLVDIAGLGKKQLKRVWQNIRMIFQDPDSSRTAAFSPAKRRRWSSVCCMPCLSSVSARRRCCLFIAGCPRPWSRRPRSARCCTR